MITDTFDPKTDDILKIWKKEDAVPVDACIATFSNEILAYVLETQECTLIGNLYSSNGANPVYGFEYKDRHFAIYMTPVGAPSSVAEMEDTQSILTTDKYIVFGGSGCLNKEIARGRVMVPTEAYRDEGTSYHYAAASDYITVKNADKVAEFMEEAGLPYIKGRTWTTDALLRETRGNFEKRKADGCISVEMECAAIEAMCDFRGFNVYYFLTSGDLLDAPKWDSRRKEGQKKHTQHDPGHFDIALELARYVTE